MAKWRLPEITPAHGEFRRRTAAAEDRTTSYVTPIYAQEDKRYALGSGVLVAVTDEHFVITAAHVIDEHTTADLYLLGSKKFLPINGRVVSTPRPPRGRQDDHVDIAVLHLDKKEAAEIQAQRQFLDIITVDPSDKPREDSLYTITGYPSSKQPPLRNGILTLEPVRFTSVPCLPGDFPKRFTPGLHFAIHYDRKRQVARNLRVERPPAPQGISGGGLFRLGTFDQILSGTSTEALVGIAVEACGSVMISTNIAVALELIRDSHPHLDQYIPCSARVNIKIES